MTAPDAASRQPVIPTVTPPTHPELHAFSGRPGPSKVGTPLRTLGMCLASLIIMAPWPLLGILLMHPYFDKETEAFMLFGGITLFPIMILALFGSVSEEVIILLLMLAWLAGCVIPNIWLRHRLRSWMAICVLLGIQSAYSLAQALMGVLLILGKNV